MEFKKNEIVQILCSKDSKGNSCITFAEIKEILNEENCVTIHHIITFCGRSPLKAPEFAEIVKENSKIPIERISKISEYELLFIELEKYAKK